MTTRISFFVCLLCMALVNAKSNRIVNGEDAHLGQFKYQVLLQDAGQKITCGAAILADQFVLTAAHCVIEKDGKFYLSNYYVIAGATDMHVNGVRIDVEKIYVPSRYRSNDRRNDIAVLKLRTGLGLGSNPNLQKINLPPNNAPSYAGRPAVIAGYGSTNARFSSCMDGRLRYFTTNIISNNECKMKISHYMIDENQICSQAAPHGKQPKGICSGDTGGPLVMENIIIGVASIYPESCKEDQFPTIYTRVSHFNDFIMNVMNHVKTRDMLVREIPSPLTKLTFKG